MRNKSIWYDINCDNVCNSINKDIEVDVLVIGGGITGLSVLYNLKNSGFKTCLVDRNKIGMGVTSKTTGKLTYLQGNIYTRIKKCNNIKKAKLYLESQRYAIKLVKNIIDKEKIKCDFEQVDSYVYTNDNKFNIIEEINLLKKLDVNFIEKDSLPDNKKVAKSYFVKDTYIFHPLKYVFALKNILINENIPIYEDTTITLINKKNNIYICHANNNLIKAKYVIVATHYPYFFKKIFLPLKSYIEKSYIVAYKVDNDYRYSSINIDKPVMSTRYYSNDYIYKIYLTNSHNTAIKNNDIKNFSMILMNIKNPDYCWSNKDIITSDFLPYIGSLDTDNTLLIGTGYNTWGMTNGALAGKILSDIIVKKQNKYIELFKPTRIFNKGIILNFPLVLGSNTYSFFSSKINLSKKWYSNRIRFELRNGKKIAIYTDSDNKEHVVYTLCPHLKCNLLFNEIEKTWDCPCHGSRFDLDGKCIEGPSNYDISYKN